MAPQLLHGTLEVTIFGVDRLKSGLNLCAKVSLVIPKKFFSTPSNSFQISILAPLKTFGTLSIKDNVLIFKIFANSVVKQER